MSSPWAENLLALGNTLARYRPAGCVQTVVVVAVPARDYAAVLVATGWLLMADTPAHGSDPSARVASLERGTPVRMIVNGRLVVDRFYGCQPHPSGTRIHVGYSQWPLDRVVALEPAEGLKDSEVGRTEIPPAGGLVSAYLGSAQWVRLFGSAGTAVALVGTKSRLDSELDLQATRGGTRPADRLRNIARPRDGRSPCWGTTLVAGGTEDPPELAPDTRLAILDGASAIRWISEIATPLIIALVDSSNPDDSASAAVLQLRSTGRPVEFEALGWSPFPGVESLAFEAPL